MKIDEMLKRIKKEQAEARWRQILDEVREWRKRRELVLIEVEVRNRVVPEVEYYSVRSEEELQELLAWIASRGPFQPFHIQEAVPGLYEVGPYEVKVRRYYQEVVEEGGDGSG